MAKAKFVVRKGSTGKFRFNLIGTNGKIIATSEPYKSRASALKGDCPSFSSCSAASRIFSGTVQSATIFTTWSPHAETVGIHSTPQRRFSRKSLSKGK